MNLDKKSEKNECDVRLENGTCLLTDQPCAKKGWQSGRSCKTTLVDRLNAAERRGQKPVAKVIAIPPSGEPQATQHRDEINASRRKLGQTPLNDDFFCY